MAPEDLLRARIRNCFTKPVAANDLLQALADALDDSGGLE
jgi:BarA-like signal transduction histidine kinase